MKVLGKCYFLGSVKSEWSKWQESFTDKYHSADVQSVTRPFDSVGIEQRVVLNPDQIGQYDQAPC